MWNPQQSPPVHAEVAAAYSADLTSTADKELPRIRHSRARDEGTENLHGQAHITL